MKHINAQTKLAKAKNSLGKLQAQINRLVPNKALPFSNDNEIGKLAQIQAWESMVLNYNQYGPALGCHE